MYKKILWATDLSEESIEALEYAVPIIQKMDAEVYALNVVPYTPFLYSSLLGESAIYAELLEEIVEETKQDLKELVEKLKEKYGIRIVRWEVIVGSPYAEIIEYAKRRNMDLILMGSRGKGKIEEFLIGSTAKKVVAKSDRDLLLVRKKKGYEKALICVDLSENSKIVLEKGKRFASIVGMDYTLFHVIESETPLPESIQREIEEKLEKLLGEKALIEYYPKASKGIIEKSKEYDIVIIGNKGHNLFEKLFLGSTAEKVATHAHSPVLIIRINN